MGEDRQFVSKAVECPNGHRIKLEMLSGTPNMIRTIQCPTCQTNMVVISGDIRGIVRIAEEIDVLTMSTLVDRTRPASCP